MARQAPRAAAQSATQPPVPTALRVGGAFLTLGIVLLIFGVVSIARDGWLADFAVSLRFLLITAAAGLFGAFVSTSVHYRGSLPQVVALGLVVVLLCASRVASNTALVVTEQYWIFMYGVAALLCALIIRRSLLAPAAPVAAARN